MENITKATAKFEKISLQENAASASGTEGAAGTIFAAATAGVVAAETAPVVKPKKKKPAEDLSFLDAYLEAGGKATPKKK